MGNDTRKCSIVGCDKKTHGRGFCISHFSAGVSNLPETSLATGECIAWEGRPEKFQAAAVRSLVLDDKEVPPWAWVVVTCGSDMCLLSDHLEIHFPQVLRYPHSEYADGYVSGHMAGVEWADANHPTAEALARVRELHRPVDVEPSETICHECSTLRGTGENKRYFPYEEWPCATYQATEVDDDD